ncbi:hypothetical protein TPHA_0L00480 [Tetrapisispora phaffii CBS 4417]|uniref:Outer spore wall protein RRT8 n=1 Tax=Tetrapisispora phaffii (strain ATCC 24235 / CBS 4417 / NBRC 1672 / NRRL Y-8282 / UCD 70-5) TaxID=1071381 RepID=G8BZS6_TETPH|nr:hypothetical protein TPHA_0L00480 [Tetrapisispora phaffii CBS 4417]CCE65404.1 hypothetical protein TPHA_0L00480 [Tetrapisispora phaffii CBS 4417]
MVTSSTLATLDGDATIKTVADNADDLSVSKKVQILCKKIYNTQKKHLINLLDSFGNIGANVRLLQGFKELFSTTIYYTPLLWYFIIYLSNFVLTFLILAAILTPIVTPFYMLFAGPFAPFLTLYYVTLVTQYTTLNTGLGLYRSDDYLIEIINLTLIRRNRGYLKNAKLQGSNFTNAKAKALAIKDKYNTVEFWIVDLPYLLVSGSLSLSKVIFVLIILLIPGLGIIGFLLINSSRNGFRYGEPYAIYRNKLNHEELTDYFYQRFAHWWVTGILTNLTELVPFLCVITRTSNYIGYSLWEYDYVVSKTLPLQDEGPKKPTPLKVLFVPKKVSVDQIFEPQDYEYLNELI